MRIALGSIMHESNTFSPLKTSLDDFRQQQLLFDEDVIQHHRARRTELGGMLEAAEVLNMQPAGTISATAVPSGPITAKTFSFFEENLTEKIKQQGPLDGVLLALHGSTVAETVDDVEGRLLERIRDIVGADVPIGLTLDHHANVTEKMVGNADFMIGYRTHPHVDQHDIGKKAAEILALLIRSNVKPVTVMKKLPMLLPGESSPVPRQRLVEKVNEIEADHGVLTASFFIGFPFADIDEVGPCSLVVAKDDESLAASRADELARLMWDMRDRFFLPTVSVEQAIQELPDTWAAPEIFVDMGDCSYAGAAGDVPFFLDALLRHGVEDAVIAAVLDKDAVDRCIQAGVGATLTLEIGGKLDRINGTPVRADGTVQFISDGKYRGRDFYLSEIDVDIGPAVVFNTRGIDVILVTRRITTYDPALLRSMNIEPSNKRVIVLKGGLLNQVTYGKIAGRIRPFNSPGFANWDFSKKTYKKIPRPVYPLDREGIRS